MSEHDLRVVELMIRRGGGFVKALGNCFMHADQENFKKLRETFSDYWVKYETQIEK